MKTGEEDGGVDPKGRNDQLEQPGPIRFPQRGERRDRDITNRSVTRPGTDNRNGEVLGKGLGRQQRRL